MAGRTVNPETVAELNKPLDAARVRQRQGSGRSLSYLETHDVIRRANEIFGHGGWGHEIVDLRQLDHVSVHNSDQKPGWCVGYVCVVRLTVEGCVPVSGIGYGDATEYRESALVTAHELAAKEAESDGLKRALKNYGDQFGLALYDKAAATSGHVTASGSNGSAKVITEPQRKRLYAMSKTAGLSDEQLKALVKEIAGVDSSKEIPAAVYDRLCEAVQAESVPF